MARGRGVVAERRAPSAERRAVHVVGGGLAGSEAAWQLAERGVDVVLHEMRPLVTTAAHKTEPLTGNKRGRRHKVKDA